MRCSAARRMLAVYRELDDASRARLDTHLRECSACRAAYEAYGRQDEALSALPELTVRPAWAAAVRARTTGAPRKQTTRRWGWVPVTAIVVALFLGASAGTIQAAGRSLPGDWLYPVKLSVEQMRLSLLRDPAGREEYLTAIRSARLEEALAVAALGRDAEVVFEGTFEGEDAGQWCLDEVRVGVPEEVWPGEDPSLGAPVRVRARVVEGALQASQVEVQYGGAVEDAASVADESAGADAAAGTPPPAASDERHAVGPGPAQEPTQHVPGNGERRGLAGHDGALPASPVDSETAVPQAEPALTPTAQPPMPVATSALGPVAPAAEPGQDRPGGGPEVGVHSDASGPAREPTLQMTPTSAPAATPEGGVTTGIQAGR